MPRYALCNFNRSLLLTVCHRTLKTVLVAVELNISAFIKLLCDESRTHGILEPMIVC